MNRRNVIRGVVVVVVVVLVGLFVVYGIPFIQDIFTPPIVGLPTATPGGSGDSGGGLRERYTQTAAAKQTQTVTTPTAAPK